MLRFALAACLTLVAGEALAACSVTVAWEAYGKYTNRAADGTLIGIDIDLMRELGRRTGCAVQFREMPFKRVLIELQNGTVDASTSVKLTPERDAYARFLTPYYHQSITLFVRKGTVGRYTLKTLADAEAAKFRIATIAGYYYGDEFEVLKTRPGFAAIIEEGLDYATSLRKLVDNRVHGLLGDEAEVVMDEARSAGFGDQIEPYPIDLPSPGVSVMFSRKSVPAEVVERMNAALIEMKADGTVQAIMNRYGS